MRNLRLRAIESGDHFFAFVPEFWDGGGWCPLDTILSVPKGPYDNPPKGSTVVIYPDEWNEGDLW